MGVHDPNSGLSLPSNLAPIQSPVAWKLPNAPISGRVGLAPVSGLGYIVGHFGDLRRSRVELLPYKGYHSPLSLAWLGCAATRLCYKHKNSWKVLRGHGSDQICQVRWGLAWPVYMLQR